MVVKAKKKIKSWKRGTRTYAASYQSVHDMLAEAIRYHQAGDIQQADILYTQILAIDSNHADALHLKGVVSYQSGKNQAAAKYIRRAININPGASYYHNNLGNALLDMGKTDEALLCFQEAVRLVPDNAEAHNNLGNVMSKLGKNDEALHQFDRAIQIDPGYDVALNNKANLLKNTGRLEDAITVYGKALERNPNSAEMHFNLGSALEEAGRLEDSLTHLKKAVSIVPEFAEAHNDLGNVFKKSKDYDKSALHYKRAIALKPEFARAHSNLGDLYRVERKFDDSLKHCKKAVSLDPAFARGHVNMGNTLLDQGSYDEALLEYERAIDLCPDLADAHYNKGLVLLMKGDLDAGWKEYEWRFRSREIASHIGYRYGDLPSWDGSPLEGRKILVVPEQGMGDHIQFLRYIPLLKRNGGKVIFECRKELVRLFQNYGYIDYLLEESAYDVVDLIPDVCVQLMSLPRIFSASLDNIIADVPYLRADPVAKAEWSSRFDHNLFNVGLVWSGNPSHRNDHNRSCKLSDFAPLTNVPGVALYSLQKGDMKECRLTRPERMQLGHLGRDLDDFYETAAAVENLDLVITVDTSVAHLAGAMGRPVWTLLPFVPDWRWMLDRSDSPWYPTMKLIRQPRPGDWNSVMNEVVSELRKVLFERSAS